MKYDLDLFLELNAEYESKPLVPAPPKYDESSLRERALNRCKNINAKVPVDGLRTLEVGCGRAEVSRALAEHYNCSAVGVDVSRYPEWDIETPNVTTLQRDLSTEDISDLGQFDLAYSNSVWEHVRHPYTMLKKTYELLKPGGYFLLSANLFRGPMASHRYREVFFPWPHLLFCDDVFNQFYMQLGRDPEGDEWYGETSIDERYSKHDAPPKTAAWVNELSIADYLRYFDLVGFEVEHVKFSMKPLDEAFIARFSDKLDRYPRYDLQRDFLHAKLRKPESVTEPEPQTRPLTWFQKKRLKLAKKLTKGIPTTRR